MTKNLSIYLEAVRFLAAIGVLLNHAKNFIMPDMPYKISGHGTECVAVFFLLSGFVIRFVNVEKNESDWHRYAVARLSRIVPVAFFALLCTICLTRLGVALAPAGYNHLGWDLDAKWDIWELLRSMTFTNEFWFNHTIFATDGPYWSLGFEVPYYIFFGLVMFMSGRLRILAMIGWALIVGPKIIAYLPLWYLGVATYDLIRRCPRFAGERFVGAIFFGVSIIGYYALKFKMGLPFHSIYIPTSPIDLVAGAAHYFSIGALCAMNFIGVHFLVGDRKLLSERAASAIRWLAGGTFTLYLLHLPIMIFIAAIWPEVTASAINGLLALAIILVASYGLAELVERRKRPAKRFFETVLAEAKPQTVGV